MTITFGAHEELLSTFLLSGISAVRNARRKIATGTLAVLPFLDIIWLFHYISGIPANAFDRITLSGVEIQRELLEIAGASTVLYMAVLPLAFLVRDATIGILPVLCSVAERCISCLPRR